MRLLFALLCVCVLLQRPTCGCTIPLCVLRAVHKYGNRKARPLPSRQINFTRLVGAETANKYLASNSLDPLLLPVTIAPCAPGTQPNQAGGCAVVWQGWPAGCGR